MMNFKKGLGMMDSTDARYFNFPIQLLDGFMVDSRNCLDKIYDYAIFAQTLKYELGDEDELIRSAERYFGTKSGSRGHTYESGEQLFDSIPENSPKVGLNKDIFFDYYKTDKTDFEKITLLGFLAIKSILQNKTYCKITNKFWLSRMDGKVKSVAEYYGLSEPIRKYSNRWQLTKIKKELVNGWNLEHYSRYTRGFYVSIKSILSNLFLRQKNAGNQQKTGKENLLKNWLWKGLWPNWKTHHHNATYRKGTTTILFLFFK